MQKLKIILISAGVLAVLVVGFWIFDRPERGQTGAVSTRFHFLGPNDKIVIDGAPARDSTDHKVLVRAVTRPATASTPEFKWQGRVQ